MEFLPFDKPQNRLITTASTRNSWTFMHIDDECFRLAALA